MYVRLTLALMMCCLSTRHHRWVDTSFLVVTGGTHVVTASGSDTATSAIMRMDKRHFGYHERERRWPLWLDQIGSFSF